MLADLVLQVYHITNYSLISVVAEEIEEIDSSLALVLAVVTRALN